MHGGNSPNYGHGGLGGGGEDPDMNEGTGVDSPSHWEEDYGKMKMSDF